MIKYALYKIRKKLSTKAIFNTRDVTIGKNVRFGNNVIFNCKKVVIGDGTVFHSDITINSDVFVIGDYGTVYSYCFFPGPGKLYIGHNFWLGYSSIVDCQGGTEIHNNIGIGPQSQLWSHMKFGDVMAGCRFHSTKKMIIEDDAWLVGHCLVSPVHIGKYSLAMLGSLITKDMKSNHVYAGAPARDVTDKIGKQFDATSTEYRKDYLVAKIEEFSKKYNVDEPWKKIDITDHITEKNAQSSKIIFDVKNRLYTKKYTKLENKLMRFLLPAAKFIPA